MKLKETLINHKIMVLNRKEITMKEINKLFIVSLLSCIFFIGMSIGFMVKPSTITHFSDGTYAISTQISKFSEDKLKKYLLEVNIEHPKVVLAQAQLETFHYKSQIFTENNNLFGMKLPRIRATTAKGEQYNHAIYSSWKESVLDYAIRQSRYASNIPTDLEYIKYLGETYAEDTLYTIKLTALYNQIDF